MIQVIIRESTLAGRDEEPAELIGYGPITDIDHTIRFPEGETTKDNLASLCRRHHRMKHTTNWTAKHQPNAALQ